MSKVIQIIEDTYKAGIKIVEVPATTIRVIMFERNDLETFLTMDISSKPAVYLLYNEPTGANGISYVGETECIGQRMQQHNETLNKTFWTYTIVLQDKCETLNKAHCKYMENDLYESLLNAKRVRVANSVIPTKSSLAIADKIYVENILRMFKEVCATLNIYCFQPNVYINSADSNVYTLKYNGNYAQLHVLSKNEMYVLKGALCSQKIESVNTTGFDDIIKLREQLQRQKKLRTIPSTCYMELLEDVRFESENEAFAFVTLTDDVADGMWRSESGQVLNIINYK